MKSVQAIAKYTPYSGVRRSDDNKVRFIITSDDHPKRLFAMKPIGKISASFFSDLEIQRLGLYREGLATYRVLGRISQSADWVKENDEITCKIELYRSFESIKPPAIHGPGNKTYEQEITDLDIAYVQCPGPCEIYH